jgi:hypothetical protein
VGVFELLGEMLLPPPGSFHVACGIGPVERSMVSGRKRSGNASSVLPLV